MGKQVHHTPLRKCSRCLYNRRDTENVSERIWPPAGGYLCMTCLIPVAMEALGIPIPLSWQEDIRAAWKTEVEPPPKDERPSIICPECHRRTYDANEIKLGYCPSCKWFTSDPLMRKVGKESRG